MNVLKITSTPIKLSMTSQRARLESRLPDLRWESSAIRGS